MLQDKLVTYEVAKLAREKGFRERCIEHYYDDTKDLYRSSTPQCYNFGGNTSDAPTQSLLQRWLREEKFIDISIYPIFINGVRVYTAYMDAPNLNKSKKFNYFDTYELVLEDVLKHALENFV